MTGLSKTKPAVSAMELTTVVKAHPKFQGFKTQIPLSYAKLMGLEHGDKIEWTLDKDGQGFYIVVRKAKIV